MKKFVSILFILILIPVLSSAITYDEDSFLGTWVQKFKSGISEFRITTIILEENHHAYYSVDFYNDKSPGDIERKVCDWSVSGNILTLSEQGQDIRVLYRLNDYQLSIDQAGVYQLFFDHVPNSEKEYYAAMSDTEPIKEPEPESYVEQESSSVEVIEFSGISDLTYHELVELKNQLNLAMWNSQEWQEVSVPMGTYKIGEDIPAGHWTITPGIDHGYFYVWYFEEPDEFGRPVKPLTRYVYQDLATEDFHAFNEEYIHSVDFDMKEGWYFYTEHTVIFTPYTGKPDLGFK